MGGPLGARLHAQCAKEVGGRARWITGLAEDRVQPVGNQVIKDQVHDAPWVERLSLIVRIGQTSGKRWERAQRMWESTMTWLSPSWMYMRVIPPSPFGAWLRKPLTTARMAGPAEDR